MRQSAAAGARYLGAAVICWLALRVVATIRYPFGGGELRAVVQCFVDGDYGLAQGVVGVEAVDAATAEQIRDYIADYGATLVELPEDTWQTSVAQWMKTHWEILVDLWTAEEGRSDLVLDGRVVETPEGPRLTIHLVYVP